MPLRRRTCSANGRSIRYVTPGRDVLAQTTHLPARAGPPPLSPYRSHHRINPIEDYPEPALTVLHCRKDAVDMPLHVGFTFPAYNLMDITAGRVSSAHWRVSSAHHGMDYDAGLQKTSLRFSLRRRL